MENITQKQIESLLGRSVGLNADWSVDAWKVGRDLFLVDDENGDVSLVRRSNDSDETWENPVTIETVAANGWLALVRRAQTTLL